MIQITICYTEVKPNYPRISRNIMYSTVGIWTVLALSVLVVHRSHEECFLESYINTDYGESTLGYVKIDLYDIKIHLLQFLEILKQNEILFFGCNFY